MSMHDQADNRSVVEQAACWYLLCADESMTLQECEEMQQWLQASPEHRLELASLFRLDALLVLGSSRLQH